MSTPLRSMVALLVLGCATIPSRYEIEYESGAVCILSTDGIGGIEGESWKRCVEQGALMLAKNPELVPVARAAWQSCKSAPGIAPQTQAMDACLREEILLGLNRARASADTGQIAGQVFLGLLGAVGRAARAASQPTYTSYPEAPTMRPPITCYTIEDGWGGSRTMCQ